MRDRIKRDVVAIGCAIVVSLVAAYMLQGKAPVDTPAVEAPVPPQTPFDYTVQVTAHGPRVSHVGSGILVKHDGVVFVLTSKMIFTPADTSYSVLFDGIKYSAGVILKDKARGLVALDIPIDFDGIELDNAPNLPPDAEAVVKTLDGTFHVTVNRWLTDPDWMIIDGGVPGLCTGAPIFTNDNHLAGIVIGVNTENAEEAFAVGNNAIYNFTNTVIGRLGVQPPRMDRTGPNDNLLIPPANPNLLFQGF